MQITSNGVPTIDTRFIFFNLKYISYNFYILNYFFIMSENIKPPLKVGWLFVSDFIVLSLTLYFSYSVLLSHLL